MFTGIIQSVGEIVDLSQSGTDMTIRVASTGLHLSEVNLGDSIAVNGTCLTVTKFDDASFSADVSHETLEKTTLGNLAVSDKVNLEKALTLSTPLGGHLVSGHVDGIGKLLKKTPDGNSTRYYFSAPTPLFKFIAVKGSITIQGISLTVNHVSEGGFDVSIIPHTESQTNIGTLTIGDTVNLEIDLIARYVARMMEVEHGQSTLTLDKIRALGF